MKICPSCHEEFIEEIMVCVDCQEDLVASDQFRPTKSNNARLSKEELFSAEMTPFVEGGLASCREVEKVLLKAKISCAVYPVSMRSDGNETLGSTSDGKYMVLIRDMDLEQARSAMQGNFLADVAKEGKGAVSTDAIDLEKDEVTCPACGETGALENGDCRVCGLHLGV